MTREEAIREIKNMAKFNYTLAPIEVFEMAIKALEDSRWIPVTERLPEETGWYLCTLHMNILDESLVDMCRFETINGHFWSGSIEFNVVAWMPLPKPYEKGAEE